MRHLLLLLLCLNAFALDATGLGPVPATAALASPGPIGATSPSTGVFTFLTVGPSAAPGSPAVGNLWLDTTAQDFIAAIGQSTANRINVYNSGQIFVSTTTVTVSNTAAETTLLGAGVGTLTIPANFMVVGKSMRLHMSGTVTNTGVPTLQIKAKLGATTIADSTAFATAVITGTMGWTLDVDLTCRTAGASGTVFAQGQFAYTPTIGTPARASLVNTAVSSAIDFTATKLVDVTATWGTASASNTIVQTNGNVENLN